jgi:ATP/maltotriose-dependent transcriptional regulator MalT/tRNA A-37 threonylcarbamoyl transferase component Bud32
MPGRRLGSQGRYQVLELIGKGGFGEAFIARDTTLDRTCVVKRLILSGRWSESVQQAAGLQFEREAQLLVSLNTPGHPNIPEIFEFLPEMRCLIMKHIVGKDLSSLMQQPGGRLPLGDALRYMRDVCDALVYMHSRQPEPVLHRDIKPSNILIDVEQRIWLIDFGLAKGAVAPALRDQDMSLAGGTPGFAAPEQWAGAAEPRSDIYALAATLHQLLTGFVPSRSELHALAAGRIARPPLREFLDAVDPLLEEFISTATAFDPALRPTAAEALAILESLISREMLPEPPQPATPPDLGDFVGREEWFTELQQRLARDGVLRLSGMAGIGKTTLAAALARRVSPDQPFFWHAFHESDAVETVFWELAAFLAHRGKVGLWELLAGRRQAGSAIPTEMLVDYLMQLLADEPVLLCFDDLQLVAVDPLASRLFSRLTEHQSGAIQLIVIERERSDLLPTVPSVPVPGLDGESTRRLMHSQGIALSAADSAQLARHTGGNPQLLLLARSLLRDSAPEAYAAHISQLASHADIRQFLLSEVYERLAEDEQSVLQALAISAGYGGTRNAIEAFLDDDRPLAAINHLLSRGLLTSSRSSAGTIYGIHAIVSDFVVAELSLRRRQRMHARAAEYYESEEVDYLRAARHYAWAGNAGQAVQLLDAQATALINTGYAPAIGPFLEQLLAQADDPGSARGSRLDHEQRIQLLLALAASLSFRGEIEPARARFMAALELLDAAEDRAAGRQRRAFAYRGLGDLLAFSDPASALDWLQGSLDLLDAQDQVERLRVKSRIGTIKADLGDIQQAGAILHACLAELPPAQDNMRADIELNLGLVYCRQGELRTGRQYFLSALPLYERRHNRWAIGAIRHNLSQISEMQGDWAGAEAEYHNALAIAEEIGAAQRQIDIRLSLGILYTNRGDFVAAYAQLERSLELARRHASRVSQIYILASLADLAIRDGRLDQAEAMLDAAEQLATELAERSQRAEILRCRARIALAYRRLAAAHELARDAIAAAGELDDEIAESLGLALLGEILAAEGQYTEAETAFAQSIAHLDTEETPYELARCRLAWGQSIPPEAATTTDRVALLEAAHTTFAHLGTRRDQAAAEEALKR